MPPRASRPQAAAATPKATQTRKASAKATSAAKAKATSTKSTSTKSTSKTTKRPAQEAPVTPVPLSPPKRQTRTSTKKSAVKVKIEPDLVDEEAIDVGEEDEELEEGEEEPDDVEERSADNTYSGEEFEGDDSVAELSADEGSVFLPPQTPKVNRIVRSHSEATSPPASQKSPSPVKKAVRLQASTQKVKTTRIIRKATPKKAAKRERSDNEDDVAEEDASPTKKTRAAVSSPEPEIEEVTSKTPKKSIKKPVLPRRTGASTDSPQKAKRTLGKPRTPAKPVQKVKAKAVKNVPESTGSAAAFFGDEDMDDEERNRKTRLFTQNLSATTDFDDVKDALLEIEEGTVVSEALMETSGDCDESAAEAVSDFKTGENVIKKNNNTQAFKESMDMVQDSVESDAMDVDATEDILDLDVEGAVDPILRDTYKGLPYLKPCTPNYGGYDIQTLLLSEGVFNQPHFQVNKRAIISLVTQSYDPKVDDPFVIAPSRVDPALIVADTKFGAKNKVLALKTETGTKRLVNFAFGVVLQCHMVEPTSFPGNKTVKQLLMVPLRGEWERAVGLYGMTFGLDSVVINTFGVSLGDGARLQGLSFRTFPAGGDTQSTKQALPGLGFTPRKGKLSAKSTGGKNATGRTFLQMIDKTTWSASEDIPIWDAREYFKTGKLVGNQFKHEIVHSLPSYKTDLEFGDLAIVYYSVSQFSTKTATERGEEASLSLNLYGAVLVAKGSGSQ